MELKLSMRINLGGVLLGNVPTMLGVVRKSVILMWVSYGSLVMGLIGSIGSINLIGSINSTGLMNSIGSINSTGSMNSIGLMSSIGSMGLTMGLKMVGVNIGVKELRGQSAAILLEQANKFSEAGNFAEAERYYERVLEKGGNKAIVYFNLGNMYFRQDRLSAAVSYYRKVIKAAPLFKNAYLNLGKLYYAIGDYVRALGIFRGYLGVDGKDYDTLVLAGSAAVALRDYYVALRYFNDALASEGDRDEPYILIAQVYEAVGDIDRAIGYLDEAELVVSEASRLRRIRGEMYMAAGRYEAAASAFAAVLAGSGGDFAAGSEGDDFAAGGSSGEELSAEERYYVAVQMVEAFEKAGLINLAIYDLKRLVVAYPRESEAVSYLEYLLLQEGRDREAFEFFGEFYVAERAQWDKRSREAVQSVFKNLLARAYNERDVTLMKDLLSYYDENDLNDEYAVLVRNYILAEAEPQ
ncbi:hypothetical protein COTS27_01238 [Spirochaetota bacterium]|nr:hypothetical protein COTS27_01238 [Spirochaetota bacterium]